jgi:hypothetical protein
MQQLGDYKLIEKIGAGGQLPYRGVWTMADGLGVGGVSDEE